MGHHAEDIAAFIQDPGDVAGRAIRVVYIAKCDAAIAFEPVEGCVVGKVVAVMMGDREVDELALFEPAGEHGLGVVNAQAHCSAYEVETGVAQQHAGQEPGFTQDLETVADA